MSAPQDRRLSRRVPVITLSVVSAALVVAVFPRLAPTLVYDRAAILSGEVWRLFTGHWVHFSKSHLTYDLLAFGIAGWMVEAKGLRGYGWLCLIAPWTINLTLLALEPDLRYCGGLSGLATCVITFLALSGLRDPPPWRWLCALALTGIIAKIALEMTTGHLLLARADTVPFVPVSTSHLAGVLTALLFDYEIRNPLVSVLLFQFLPQK